jgi:hypothetical protein
VNQITSLGNLGFGINLGPNVALPFVRRHVPAPHYGERQIEYPPQRVEALRRPTTRWLHKNRTLDFIAFSITPTGFVL